MFNPKTKRIQNLAKIFPEVIIELENIFMSNSNVYLDWQNVIHWQDKLGWHIHIKRLKDFLDSFDTIKTTYVYTGILDGGNRSKENISEFTKLNYRIETKSVKIMRYSINFSSIHKNSVFLLQPFIKKPLLSILNVETIEFLNNLFRDLNKRGIFYLEDKKCNFDVEIARDIFLDLHKDNTDNFILWSGDSDFVDPINAVIKAGKGMILFSTSGKVSLELSRLKILMFDIKKIKEFICWPKEISQSIKDKIDKLDDVL